jgi:hypothetical protein
VRSTNPLVTAYGLSLFGGVIIFLGWVGFGIWPLELVALVPLWAALELIRGRSWKAALGVSWLYGTVGIAGGYHWMVEFFQVFSGFGLLASLAIFVVFSMYLGAQYATMGVLYWAIRGRGWGVAIAALSTFIVTEWLFPKLFPIYLANTLLQQPLLVQTADLGGPLLVSMLIGVVNVAAFEALRWWRGVHSSWASCRRTWASSKSESNLRRLIDATSNRASSSRGKETSTYWFGPSLPTAPHSPVLCPSRPKKSDRISRRRSFSAAFRSLTRRGSGSSTTPCS